MHFSGSLMKTIWNVRISSNICSCVEGAGRGGRWGTCCRAAGVNFDDGSQLSGEHSLLCSATLFWSSNIKMSSAVCCMYLSDFGFFILRHYFGIFISPLLVQSVSKCGGEPLVYVVQGGHWPRTTIDTNATWGNNFKQIYSRNVTLSWTNIETFIFVANTTRCWTFQILKDFKTFKWKSFSGFKTLKSQYFLMAQDKEKEIKILSSTIFTWRIPTAQLTLKGWC